MKNLLFIIPLTLIMSCMNNDSKQKKADSTSLKVDGGGSGTGVGHGLTDSSKVEVNVDESGRVGNGVIQEKGEKAGNGLNKENEDGDKVGGGEKEGHGPGNG